MVLHIGGGVVYSHHESGEEVVLLSQKVVKEYLGKVKIYYHPEVNRSTWINLRTLRRIDGASTSMKHERRRLGVRIEEIKARGL
jgi:hypothetical protein